MQLQEASPHSLDAPQAPPCFLLEEVLLPTNKMQPSSPAQVLVSLPDTALAMSVRDIYFALSQEMGRVGSGPTTFSMGELSKALVGNGLSI